MFKNIVLIALLLVFPLKLKSQIKSKPFNELKGIDSVKNQVNFNSVNIWSFIISDISGDSLELSRKIRNLKNNDYQISDIMKFEDESESYLNNFFVSLSQRKKYSSEDLEKQYHLISELAKSINVAVLGFEVNFEESLATIDYKQSQINTSNGTEGVNLSIRVVDYDNNPLAYVEVGIDDKGIGGLTDEKGQLILSVSAENRKHPITITSFGFIQTKITQDSSLDYIVKLEKEYKIHVKSIEEVVLKGKKNKYYEVGVLKARPNVMGLVRFNSNEGAEVGKMFENKGRVRIKSFSVYIGSNSKSNFKLKGRIYESKNNNPSTIIYEKLISSDIKSGWIEVVLEKPLFVNGDFLIAFQWVGDQVDNPVFSLGRGKSNLNLIRARSRATWISTEMNWGIKVKLIEN